MSAAKRARGSDEAAGDGATGAGAPAIDGSTPAFHPSSAFVKPMLTDLYQITMAYAYWKNGKSEDSSVFDLFFRKNPFGGEFTIFAGLDECLRFVSSFKFSDDDIAYLKTQLPPTIEDEFLHYLRGLNTEKIKIYAFDEGSVVFPRVPMIRVEGPLIVAQLLETTLLCIVNFASLVATNTVRYKIAAQDKSLFEFGLRRAQGPDGAMSASRYAYVGGADATSNVLAGQLFGIPIVGTHAHSFVTSFQSPEDVTLGLTHADGVGRTERFMDLVLSQYQELQKLMAAQHRPTPNTNQSELAAFASYAIAFPSGFLALIDTYDVLRSGAINFCAVALALLKCGYIAKGVRLDSGDLAYQSRECRALFTLVANEMNFPELAKVFIVGSNEISEQTIYSLNSQENGLTTFAVGTHLVTCYTQPALGAVYKLVEVGDRPCIKLSAEVEKVTIPGRKECFRIYGRDGRPICDLLQLEGDQPPKPGASVPCRHPFLESKRAVVIPSKVEKVLKLFWDGKLMVELPTIREVRKRVAESWRAMRGDHIRVLNPTPYKVSVSSALYEFTHKLWLDSAPVGELS